MSVCVCVRETEYLKDQQSSTMCVCLCMCLCECMDGCVGVHVYVCKYISVCRYVCVCSTGDDVKAQLRGKG